jgi:hypothetical protein
MGLLLVSHTGPFIYFHVISLVYQSHLLISITSSYMIEILYVSQHHIVLLEQRHRESVNYSSVIPPKELIRVVIEAL